MALLGGVELSSRVLHSAFSCLREDFRDASEFDGHVFDVSRVSDVRSPSVGQIAWKPMMCVRPVVEWSTSTNPAVSCRCHASDNVSFAARRGVYVPREEACAAPQPTGSPCDGRRVASAVEQLPFGDAGGGEPRRAHSSNLAPCVRGHGQQTDVIGACRQRPEPGA